ncbi:LuxR family two component transcriptional regulator [Actinocorallia herbida]|uniref:LuxR family two component transcriptional regulator n=1 Tax=Actinocorallia herbida TaxID=58109 RepID=A0A3N1CPK1_9ACTN|nr:response regulator transcription factor [Actinocorallia herbida]ROO83239.1 LuxR family two component transcriptional regulator [Actinocorallia herbida]
MVTAGEDARVRVLLADDEPLLRAGVRAVLAADPGLEVVAEAGDGHEAVAGVLAHRPDVVLLDIRMPRMDGLEAAAELRRTAPETAVVILTTFSEDAYITRALAEGADGFLLKTGDPRDLLAGVRAAASGGVCLAPSVARRLVDGLGGERLARAARARDAVARLTPRERDVLALVAEGLSNAEIGRRLHLVEGTVKAHVSSILARLDAANRVQAAIRAHEAGLL